MSASIFETDPSDHEYPETYNGIDLLSGLQDMSGGKVLKFFRDMIDERGEPAFIAYSRLSQRVLLPHYIRAYAEQLVIKTHILERRRASNAWQLVRDELDFCLEYVDCWGTQSQLALPVLISSPDEGLVAWDMRYTGGHQYYAALLLPVMEGLRQFADNENALGDISELIAYYAQDKTCANPEFV